LEDKHVWDDEKQQRLNELQSRSEVEPLTADDQRLLEALLYELEQAEWTALRPALSGLRDDQKTLAADVSRLRAQNAVVAALADRYADLLARASAQLARLTSEREALRQEYERAVR
jgi:hypothetical protein